jgi:hypothetical protein
MQSGRNLLLGLQFPQVPESHLAPDHHLILGLCLTFLFSILNLYLTTILFLMLSLSLISSLHMIPNHPPILDCHLTVDCHLIPDCHLSEGCRLMWDCHLNRDCRLIRDGRSVSVHHSNQALLPMLWFAMMNHHSLDLPSTLGLRFHPEFRLTPDCRSLNPRSRFDRHSTLHFRSMLHFSRRYVSPILNFFSSWSSRLRLLAYPNLQADLELLHAI